MVNRRSNQININLKTPGFFHKSHHKSCFLSLLVRASTILGCTYDVALNKKIITGCVINCECQGTLVWICRTVGHISGGLGLQNVWLLSTANCKCSFWSHNASFESTVLHVSFPRFGHYVNVFLKCWWMCFDISVNFIWFHPSQYILKM